MGKISLVQILVITLVCFIAISSCSANPSIPDKAGSEVLQSEDKKEGTKCTVLVEENGGYIPYNKPREELEKQGKKIIDVICEGDEEEDGARLGPGVIASLAG